MPIQRRSKLKKLLLTFDEEGKYATGETLFEEGAWDTDAQDWVGTPTNTEYPVSNVTPEAKKFLNDVLGVATTKALEAAQTATEALDKHRSVMDHRLLASTEELNKLARELKSALATREAVLERANKLDADIARQQGYTKNAHEAHAKTAAKLDKIPTWLRRLFGAV